MFFICANRDIRLRKYMRRERGNVAGTLPNLNGKFHQKYKNNSVTFST